MSNKLTLDEAMAWAEKHLAHNKSFGGTETVNDKVLVALLEAVEQMRPVITTAVEWRRDGLKRTADFAYRIDPLLDAIDTYRTGREGRE